MNLIHLLCALSPFVAAVALFRAETMLRHLRGRKRRLAHYETEIAALEGAQAA